jgi:hypothetical protein
MTLSPSAFQLWVGRSLSMFQLFPDEILGLRPGTSFGPFRSPELGSSLLVDSPSFLWLGISSLLSIFQTCRLPTGGFFIGAS